MKRTKHISGFIGLLLILYLLFVAFLYTFQDTLIFFPRAMSEKEWQEVAEELSADYVTIRVNEEGNHLQGWFLGAEGIEDGGSRTIIFFGGNAMIAKDIVYELHRLRRHGISVLLTDYRGYGLSEGKPSAEAMKADAEKLFDAAASHPLVDAERITAWGVSIGSAVAAHLASTKPIEKVILMAPFTSSLELAKRSFPFVPVSLLLKHHFDTLALAPSLNQSALIVHGANDNQLSPEHAERIADVWGGEVELMMIPGRGHQDLLIEEGVWENVIQFVGAPR